MVITGSEQLPNFFVKETKTNTVCNHLLAHVRYIIVISPWDCCKFYESPSNNTVGVIKKKP